KSSSQILLKRETEQFGNTLQRILLTSRSNSINCPSIRGQCTGTTLTYRSPTRLRQRPRIRSFGLIKGHCHINNGLDLLSNFGTLLRKSLLILITHSLSLGDWH